MKHREIVKIFLGLDFLCISSLVYYIYLGTSFIQIELQHSSFFSTHANRYYYFIGFLSRYASNKDWSFIKTMQRPLYIYDIEYVDQCLSGKIIDPLLLRTNPGRDSTSCMEPLNSSPNISPVGG